MSVGKWSLAKDGAAHKSFCFVYMLRLAFYSFTNFEPLGFMQVNEHFKVVFNIDSFSANNDNLK